MTEAMKVGMIIPTQGWFEALPVGAVWGPKHNEGERYTKVPGGYKSGKIPAHKALRETPDSTVFGFSEHFNTLTYLPSLQMGEPVDRLDALPPWSLVEYDTVTYLKCPDGFRPLVNGVPFRGHLGRLRLDGARLVRDGEGDGLSLSRFQWRYRQATLWAIEQRRWHPEVYSHDFEAMGIGELPELGAGVTIKAACDLDTLQDGSIVQVGTSMPSVFHRDGDWQKVYGDYETLPDARRKKILLMNGREVPSPSWWNQPPPFTISELTAVAEWKALCFRVGLKVKAERRWCAEFDAIARKAGVDQSALDSPLLRFVNADAIAGLPEGTVVISDGVVSSSNEGWSMWYRDNRATNKTKTRRICGSGEPAFEPPHRVRSQVRVVGTVQAASIPANYIHRLPPLCKVHIDSAVWQTINTPDHDLLNESSGSHLRSRNLSADQLVVVELVTR